MGTGDYHIYRFYSHYVVLSSSPIPSLLRGCLLAMSSGSTPASPQATGQEAARGTRSGTRRVRRLSTAGAFYHKPLLVRRDQK